MNDDDRLSAIEELNAQLEDHAKIDPDFRRATSSVPGDLTRISEHLQRDPDCWRYTRALHVVHVPSFTTALRLYREMGQGSGTPDTGRDEILAAFSRSAGLFSQARKTLDERLANQALVEISTLADGVPEPVREEVARSGLLGRARGKLTAIGARATDNIAEAAGGAWADMGARLGALPKLGGAFGQSVMGIVSDNVTTPVAIRLSASGRAIEAGIGTGVGLGIVVGILCPPLLPLTAGGAVLSALGAYGTGVDELSALHDQEREDRRAELRQARAQALRELAQGADALQMESDELSLTVDVETGQADAVVLSGPAAGRTYSSLTDAERREIRSRSQGRSASEKQPGVLLDILDAALCASLLG